MVACNLYLNQLIELPLQAKNDTILIKLMPDTVVYRGSNTPYIRCCIRVQYTVQYIHVILWI